VDETPQPEFYYGKDVKKYVVPNAAGDDQAGNNALQDIVESKFRLVQRVAERGKAGVAKSGTEWNIAKNKSVSGEAR
jgi:hypothetical protein